jgi:DNA-binding response OmpR family regulator
VAVALDMVGRGGIDAALLDLEVSDGSSIPVALALMKAGVPYALSTGHGPRGLPRVLDQAPVLSKPFEFEALQVVLNVLLAHERRPPQKPISTAA